MEKQMDDETKNKKLRVLMIEEKQNTRIFFSGFLKSSEDFTVITAGNTKDAFDILAKESVDIQFILFDWKMNEMAGNIFAQKVRKDPNYDHIEFIVYSQILTDDDNFLMAELDIYHTFPKIINGKSFLIKMDEIKKSYLAADHIRTQVKRLQHAIHTEDVKQCEEIMKEAKVRDELISNPRFFYLGGELLILKNQYGEAIDFFQSHIKDETKSNAMLTLKSMSSLGKALCLAGRYEEALMIFERLEAKSSKNLTHKSMSGEALLGLNKNYMAEEKFKEVIELCPDNTDALMGLGKINSLAGKPELAKSFFDKIQGDFESKHLASFYNNKGVSLVKQHKYEEAISFYKNAMQYFHKYRGHINFNLGLAYFKSGNVKEACSYFQEALASNEFDLIPEKKLLIELQEKGIEQFEEKYKSRVHKIKKNPYKSSK